MEHKFINPTPKLDDNSIDQWFKVEYQHAADLYCNGDMFQLSSQAKEKSSYLSEYLRAIYVLKLHGFSDISRYSILPNVLKDLLFNYGKISKEVISNPDVTVSQILNPNSKSTNRKEKYHQVTKWCKENAGKKIKVQDVAKLVDWSYPTANNFVQSRVDLFVKFSRGVYTLRNPDQDRQKDKNPLERDIKNATTKGRSKKV
jgi:hypothetical protein